MTKIYLILLLSLILSLNLHSLNLKIAHINDSHAHIQDEEIKINFGDSEEFKGKTLITRAGGFARLITKIKNLRLSHPNFLFLHSGDVFQGTLFFTKYSGLADLDFLNLAGLDAHVPGNHEFDEGSKSFSKYIDRAEFPILGANINASANKNLRGKIKPYIIRNMNGKWVGIFGLTLPEMGSVSKPEKNIYFEDHIKTAKEIVDQLTEEGVNIIILLSHLGIKRDEEIAKNIAGIDIIVGGHSHTLMGSLSELGMDTEYPYPHIVNSPEKKPVLIVHAWKWLMMLGILDVTFNDDGDIIYHKGSPVILCDNKFIVQDSKKNKSEPIPQIRDKIINLLNQMSQVEMVEEDPQALKMLEKMLPPIEELNKQILATASEKLNHTRLPNVAHPDTGIILPNGSEIAPHICLSILDKLNDMSLNPDIAMINAAAVKVPQIPEGNISVGQIFSLIPYKNVIAVLNIKGKNIRKSLEHGVHHAFVNDETGGFPYTAGLRYKIVKDGEKIFKVENIEILTKENSWVPLDDNMIYRMATYTYLINGGNGYTDLKDTSGEIYDSGITDIETFMDYLIKNKSIRKLPDANISTNF